MYNLASEEKNDEILQDCDVKINQLLKTSKKIQINCFLSGENDNFDIYLEIHAGAGGTESQDWAEMLRRMYLKWSDNKNHKYQIVSEHRGDEAGIKSTTLKIDGDYVFGWLKKESGIHRLVRISPFDSNSRRHTSFASVFVYPSSDDEIEIDIDNNDLRVDTYRASGAGGQHVNKTDSAIRITHIPSGVVVQCQNQRSQHKNKASALKVLKARLYQLEIDKEKEAIKNLENKKMDIAWGSQIRSYVFHPYNMVKDHRTNKETGNIDAVMDGKIDGFMRSFLIHNIEVN